MSERSVDQKLVARVQKGDKAAFDLLVRKYQHKVAKLIARYVRDRAEIEDVAQEAFIKAYRAIGGFRGESAPTTFLASKTVVAVFLGLAAIAYVWAKGTTLNNAIGIVTLAIGLGFAATLVSMGVRPQLLELLYLAATLLIVDAWLDERLGQGRLWVATAAGSLLWANTHGSFLLLPGVLAIVTVAALVGRDRRWWQVGVATGFALAPERRGRPGRRHQVNRPFEGVPGRPSSEETATPRARRVYETYERGVLAAAQGPLLFYVEIHGNNRPETARRIEIATVGVDHDEAARLRTLAQLIRDAHLAGAPGAPRLDVRVEPADPIFYTASGAKRDGVLRLPERALHIELPQVARADFRALYTAILAQFLAESATLPPRP